MAVVQSGRESEGPASFARSRVLLIGDGDLVDEMREALDAAQAQVKWLKDAGDQLIRDALEETRPEVVAVVSREDAMPLRVALLVRHIDADVPLLVTIFDPSIAEQARDTIPHCRVTSLADIVAPSLAGPCVDPDLAAVHPEGDGLVGLRPSDGHFERVPLPPARARRGRALLTSVLKPYDRSATLLFYGLIGIVVILSFETFSAMAVVHQPFADAFYGATKSLTTVGPNEAVTHGPAWFKIVIALSMLLAVISAAAFTGGLINRLVDRNLTGLIGQRSMPRSDHVVVIGLGQVGLRLCLLLRDCGVPVVAVDPDMGAENVGLARRLKLPVIIGSGADHAMLQRLSLTRARALAAVTPDDQVNIATAMTARSVNEDLRVLLRAGDGEVAEETRSLLAIGHVVDVHRVGAAYIAAVALGSDAVGVAVREGRPYLLLPDGRSEVSPVAIDR